MTSRSAPLSGPGPIRCLTTSSSAVVEYLGPIQPHSDRTFCHGLRRKMRGPSSR